MQSPNRRTLLRSLLTFGVFAGLLFSSASAWARTKMTTFDPAKDGFNFSNTFNNDVLKEMDIRTGGLCGGMVYSALDYFHHPRPIPRQDYRPANRTPLQSYIYDRQVQSLVPNATKWAEIGMNPDGARNGEFYRWGLTSEFRNLRNFIDRNQPVPLGVYGVDNRTHQILAIGYEMGSSRQLETIFVYDPNFPNEIVAMRPNRANEWFEYVGKSKASKPHHYHWRTYFVDKSYARKTPGAVSTPNYPRDGKIREIVVGVDTGADDLRGSNDNVHVTLHLKNGSKITRKNVNLGARWLRNYTENASVKLPTAVRKSDILAVELSTTFSGGVGGDNWDTTGIRVSYYEHGNERKQLVSRGQFFRFTGSKRSLRLAIPGATKSPAPAPARPDDVTALKLVIKTGGDDLRGNEDNVNATILYRDGRKQTVKTVNHRKRWEDHKEKTVWLTLSKPVPRGDIVGVTLSTTFRGGMGGDNWNVDKLTVVPVVGSSEKPAYFNRSGSPLKRFTGDSKTHTVRW